VKEGAAEFAVGDTLQPDRFLLLDNLPDGIVFDRAQLVSGDLVPLKPLTRLFEPLRPQKAPYMIRTEWRFHVSQRRAVRLSYQQPYAAIDCSRICGERAHRRTRQK
jgi:hypothetical protein